MSSGSGMCVEFFRGTVSNQSGVDAQMMASGEVV
jgi:hypothetical protein